jgi:copper transport protein
VIRTRSRIHALLAVAAVAAALVVLLPSPASAHASLVSTDPGSGQVVDSPPKAITLRFNEGVQVLPSAIRLYDSRGDRIDVGEAGHPDGNDEEVRASVPRLENGTYVVTWRVVSEDAHPIRASFVFTVGTGVPPSQLDTLVDRLLDEQGGSTATGVAYGISRGVVFGGLTLLIGGAAFLVMVWPAGRDSKRARGIVWTAWALTFVFTLLAIGLEGAYTDALPLGDAFSPGTIGDVLDTRYGRIMLLRLALLLLALPLLHLLLRRRPSAEYPLARWWAPVAGVLAIGLLLTPGWAGHASTGRWVALAIPTDIVHLGGVALWLGGLVLLALAVLPRSSVEELREVLPRYSRQAFWCIAVIIVSGGLQAWRQIGSLSELRDTDYGRILVVKLLVFGGLIIVAAFSREIVNRTFRAPREPQPTTGTRVLAGAGGPSVEEPPGEPRDPGDAYSDYDEYDEYDFEEEYDEDSERRRLNWSVLLEVVIACGILAVTALLVNAAPARTAPVDGIAQVTMKSPTVWVDVEATPGRAGTNEVHVTALDPNGTLTNVDDITMRASLPDRDVAPIDVELRDLGPGHYVANALTFPFPGEWRLEAQVTVTGNEVEALAGTLDIG